LGFKLGDDLRDFICGKGFEDEPYMFSLLMISPLL
jgi:hypothetical protein